MSEKLTPPKLQTPEWTPEQVKARRRKAAYTAIALGLFVVMIYLVTMVKLGVNVLQKPF